jgi:hypothetical protein
MSAEVPPPPALPGAARRARIKRWLVGGAILVTAVLGAIAFWPARGSHAGYPFARRLAGSDASPLWQMPPEVLESLTIDDVGRLSRALERLDKAVAHARAERDLLSTDRVEDLDAAERQRVRDVWVGFLDPLLAVDDLKARYRGWYGVDWIRHPGLHARAYALAFASLCAEVDAGQALMELVQGKKLAQSLFDEAMPERGMPAGTFRRLQAQLLRSRDYSYVPIGADWFLDWINPQLHNGPAGERAAQLVAARLGPAQRWTKAENAGAVLVNKTDVVRDEAFSRWFPVQKEVATWFGDTRVAPDGRRLISDAQLHGMQKALRPGDVIVERRNWYLSNVGLPGFWPHAALYVGTQDEVRAALDGDDEVRARYGGAFSEHLARTRSAAWAELGKRDAGGHAQVVVEAISDGVVATSLEHSCGADYVAVMRPRFPKVAVARALDRALSHFGKPYDFDFDFATDDSIVCSELVMKAYEPSQDLDGLRVPWITVAGRRAVPPTEIVRVFAAELGEPEPQLEFVWFLDGREREKAAVVADAAALAGSVHRPKWDIAQP